MLNRLTQVISLSFICLIATKGYCQDDKLELLLKRSPARPNAIGYVNVQSLNKLIDSRDIGEAAANNVDEYWFIADLDVMGLRPNWEAGYATLKQTVSAKMLAEKLGGYVDEVEHTEVVWAPNKTYLVPGKDNRLGILRPANRKLLAGWLGLDTASILYDYLQVQAKRSETYLSFMLAVELKNIFSPVPLADKLEGFESLKSQSPEGVSRILSSIQGVSIIVGRRGLNECIVQADFAKSPKGIKPIAVELFAEIISRNGTAAPEVLTWEVEATDTSLRFKGPITEATLSGVMGIFSLRGTAGRVASSLSSEAKDRSAEQQLGYSSKYYFGEVNEIIERTRDHKSTSTGAMAKWNDQRARQIDEIGTLNVDEDMVLYGTNVAEMLRGNALTVRQGNIQAGKMQAGQSLNRGYYGNSSYGGGYYDANSTSDYQNVTAAYARGNAYANYKEALNAIDKMTAQVRRDMTAKYKIQF